MVVVPLAIREWHPPQDPRGLCPRDPGGVDAARCRGPRRGGRRSPAPRRDRSRIRRSLQPSARPSPNSDGRSWPMPVHISSNGSSPASSRPTSDAWPVGWQMDRSGSRRSRGHHSPLDGDSFSAGGPSAVRTRAGSGTAARSRPRPGPRRTARCRWRHVAPGRRGARVLTPAARARPPALSGRPGGTISPLTPSVMTCGTPRPRWPRWWPPRWSPPSRPPADLLDVRGG